MAATASSARPLAMGAIVFSTMAAGVSPVAGASCAADRRPAQVAITAAANTVAPTREAVRRMIVSFGSGAHADG